MEEKIEDILYDIKESLKSLSSSVDSIKNKFIEPKAFDDGHLVEIDSLKTQKQEIVKQTKEMGKQTKLLIWTFIASIIALIFQIIKI